MDRYANAPRVMFPWSLAYEEYRLQVIRFSLKVVICPFTKSDDLVVLIQPLLDSSIPVPVSPIGKIFYVTTMTLTSIHPHFALIIVFEEAILDRLLKGLTDGIIFDVHLKPEHLHPNNILLCLLNDIIDLEPVNVDNVIQVLREEVSGPVNQMIPAGILHLHNVDAHIILNALTE